MLNWQVSITSKIMELAIFIILPFLNYTAYTASKRLLSTEQDTELWLPDSIHYISCIPPPPYPEYNPQHKFNNKEIHEQRKRSA